MKVETFSTDGHTSAASNAAHYHANATRGTTHMSFSAMQRVMQQDFGATPCVRRRPLDPRHKAQVLQCDAAGVWRDAMHEAPASQRDSLRDGAIVLCDALRGAPSMFKRPAVNPFQLGKGAANPKSNL
ncbi:hypothetical protein HAX54_006371 [Datura stramonium]|uniref:Uncharacterized protein n=1 Tax=Datura stramonium TaxID=4076 RepID=A0ABS8TA70_DATST|nr:hypothetical protein [Datura stramonium]